MNKFKAASPQTANLLLRAGLVIVLLYAGFGSLFNPEDWIGYLPDMATDLIDGDILLKFFSLYEFGLAIWLISGVYLRLAGMACALTFAGIIVTSLQLLDVTFRDIGLLFAALALAALAPKR